MCPYIRSGSLVHSIYRGLVFVSIHPIYVFWLKLNPFTFKVIIDMFEIKNLPANAGDASSIPGSGRSPGERNGKPLQCFAWKIPWTGEPGGLQSMELHGV